MGQILKICIGVSIPRVIGIIVGIVIGIVIGIFIGMLTGIVIGIVIGIIIRTIIGITRWHFGWKRLEPKTQSCWGNKAE